MLTTLKECDESARQQLAVSAEVRRDHRDALSHELLRADQPGPIFDGTIASADSFLRLELRWQALTNDIAPRSHSLQLGDIIQRMGDVHRRFENLCETGEKQAWFKTVSTIIDSFSYDKFGLVALEPTQHGQISPKDAERYSIFEGQHRSLALAWLIAKNPSSFAPIRVLALFPRRTPPQAHKKPSG